jgi:hypothetical protein
MKIKEIDISTDSRGVLEEKLFSLSVESLPFIFNILRSTLYSNKELAILREYTSNNLDSHEEAGKANVPVKITLPNALEPVLKFRDYGRAMTHEEIRNVFTEYGVSTKRDSNSYIGAYGIGSKVFWSYTDMFNVISYQNGIKKNYTCYLDPTQVGALAYLGEETTDEPDGLEVSGPINPQDIGKFISEAQTLYEYFPIRPVLEGADVSFENAVPLFEGVNKSWFILPKKENSYHDRKPLAIISGVPYTLETSSLDWTNQDANLRYLLKVGIMLRFPIGELEVSASRESLAYTQPTQKAIFARLAEAKTELVDMVGAQIHGAKTMYEARILHSKVFDYGSNLYAIKDLFNKSVSFGGKPVNSNFWQIEAEDGVTVRHWKKSNSQRHIRARSEENSHIFCANLSPIVLNDINLGHGVLNRIAPLLEKSDNHLGYQAVAVQVIDIKDAAKYDKWAKDEFFDAPIIKMSDLPACKLKDIYTSIANGGNSYLNPMHTQKVFRLITDNTKIRRSYSRRGRSNSIQYWETHKIDLDTYEGVYVVINSFNYQNKSGYEISPSELFNLKASVLAAGIDWPTELIGIKVSEAQKNPPKKMVTLWAYIVAKLKEKIEAEKLEQHIVDCNAHTEFTADDDQMAHVLYSSHKFSYEVGGVLGQFVSHANSMKCQTNERIEHIISLGKSFGVSLSLDKKASFDLRQDAKAVRRVYPLLPALEHRIGDNIKALNHYIGLVEGCADCLEDGKGI